MTTSYDVIIVGGGVIGSSIAFHLAKKKRKVLLVEKDRIGCEASSAAAGMLGAQAEITEAGPFYDMAQKSRSLFPAIAEELKECSGIDVHLVNKGLLKVARSEDEGNELKRLKSFYQKQGQRAEWLSDAELLEREPNLSRDLIGAMYLPDDGHVLAPELTSAFARAASILGVSLREYTTTTGIIIQKDRIIGVETNGGNFYSDTVVVASGVWSGTLLQQTGLHLPLYPVKGECFSLLYPAAPITATVISEGCYIVPKQRGRLIVGATMAEGQYDKKVTLKGIRDLLTKAETILPNIVEGEWEKAWTGLRPQTPDGLPYMGKHPEIEGLFIAAGHFRNGILLSPITGQWMTELIEGDRQEETLQPFRVDRFSKTLIAR
ncbi:glycine oxidase ThiO [Bacillus methanolicus]|uniref:glycine oxidase ThiO n=1 Tax=Bacillus methanolicus TaxID=1471 RepID=UPI00237FEBDF|nr:glycine oxidase ThiO [Bacillus methanolicus]MDE3840674.1 glycine oxidase ThiO [Bacillus methanolicus]